MNIYVQYTVVTAEVFAQFEVTHRLIFVKLYIYVINFNTDIQIVISQGI
jgi:hypothetical protein